MYEEIARLFSGIFNINVAIDVVIDLRKEEEIRTELHLVVSPLPVNHITALKSTTETIFLPY